jgi:AraC-like DNA-binding protein
MLIQDSFFADIKSIRIAHEFTLDRLHKCEYPEGRGSYGLVFAISGDAEYRFFSGERIKVCAGDTFLISKSAAYSILTEKEFRHYTVNFDVHEETSTLPSIFSPYYIFRGSECAIIEPQFKKLVDIWGEKKLGYQMLSIGCLYELISYAFSSLGSNYRAESASRLIPAREFIGSHFNEPLCLCDLAALCNMSVTNFRREWQKQYSDTPIRYRDELRLSCAREYLALGYYSVSEVAAKCGFDDVSYFIRFFKKHTGVTPYAHSRKNA